MNRRVLLISGSTRSRSTNSAWCRTVAALGAPGVIAEFYPDLTALPHFNPDDDHEPLPPAVASLRSLIGAADAVVFCTPEYAGTLPGSLKNLLDWTVGGTELNGKPVAWVNVAGDPRRGAGAHATLATVLNYVEAVVVAAACLSVPVRSDDVRSDGFLVTRDSDWGSAAVLEAVTVSRPDPVV